MITCEIITSVVEKWDREDVGVEFQPSIGCPASCREPIAPCYSLLLIYDAPLLVKEKQSGFFIARPLQASGPAEIRCAAPADSPEELPAPPVPAGAAGAAARGAAGPHLHHQRKYPCSGSLCSSSSNPAGGSQAACKQACWKLLWVWVKVERNQNM